MLPIYLDYNATTPIDPQVATAMRPYLNDQFGNPGSAHAYGIGPRRAVDSARQQVADCIGARPEEIIFTSGGSEANNLAINGVFEALGSGHIITSAIEHPAVSEVCQYLAGRGASVTIVPVNRGGLVDPTAIADAIRKDTILISVMMANNEVGTVQPIADIARIASESQVLLHCDAAQAIGKIPVDVEALGVDLLTIVGHKIYAHKGIGALFCRKGTLLKRQIHGGGQEGGMRAGTENVLQIVGLGAACDLINTNPGEYHKTMQTTRDYLQYKLLGIVDDSIVNGDQLNRLPNTLSLGIGGVQANALVNLLGEKVAFSAGAACHSDRIEISGTLQAMGVPAKYAAGTIRLSTGRYSTISDIDCAIDHIVDAVNTLRRF